MTESASEDVVIIGSGPAGLTSSVYLSRAGYSPIVIAGSLPGGQLTSTDLVENFPGFESIQGQELMMKMLAQAERLGARLIYEQATGLTRVSGGFRIEIESGKTMEAKAVLIATGAKHKHLGVKGEDEFMARGVSWCATCDGPLYRGSRVAVIGGGNTAAMETLFLANLVEKVFLIHRRDTLRADKLTQARVFSNEKIECIWNSAVLEICGNSTVSSLKIKNLVDSSKKELEIKGVFISIGTDPVSSIAKHLVALDESGYVIAPQTETSCEGLFAAGDVVSGSLKQAVYAAGQGALSAKKIELFLEKRG
jgi:thioredoxin reductase (NADPH)